MNFGDKIKAYFSSGENRYKLILIGVAALTMVLAVLFSSNIQNLFNRPAPSEASTVGEDISKTWENLTAGNSSQPDQTRAHAKSIAVNQGGKHWLYVIGGLQIYTDTITHITHNRLVKTVQRIEIDPETSAPIENAVWQNVASMNSGHAEFGVLETTVNNKPYIYVVAGDIHVPTISESDALENVAMLYSTIERLDLSINTATWEVVANLTGVNFYPEIAMFNGRLHIVGGIYGNPFGQLDNCGPSAYRGSGTDPIDPDADRDLWNNITKNKPTVGSNSVVLPVAQTNGGVAPIVNDALRAGPVTGNAEPSGVQSKPITQLFKRLFAGVPKASAQSTGEMTITKPEAGAVLKPGIKYTIQVENIPPIGNYYDHIALYYSTVGLAPYGSSDWKLITNYYIDPQNFPLGISRFYYDWTVPGINPPSTRVFVRAVVWNNNLSQQIPLLPYIATSGQFSIGISMAHLLSQAMIAGEFVTTVSEHYVINLASPSVGARVSELGNDTLNDTTPNDYGGTLPANPVWQEKTIMRIGHLRFTTYNADPNNDWSPMKFTPVPQGRYGHKLFLDGDKLVVVGGASWMPKINLNWSEATAPGSEYLWFEYALTTRYFWVIENSNFPAFIKPSDSNHFDKRYEPLGGGHYIGHIAYTLSSSTAYWSPSEQYSFNSSDGNATKKGRAFFGFAKAGNEWLAIGGLENTGSDYAITEFRFLGQPSNEMSYSGRIATQATSRVVGLQTISGVPGWAERESYINGEKVYNVSAFSLGDRLIAYSGQTEFCSAASPSDPHVPDPSAPVSNTTTLYKDSGDVGMHSWNRMADLGSEKNEGSSGTGLRGEYFNEETGKPGKFRDFKFVRTDNMVLFNWYTSSPDEDNLGVDDFSVRWTGSVKTTNVAGRYTFYIRSDSGARLWIGGHQIINDWSEHGWQESSGTIDLEANTKYSINLEYYESTGEAGITLSWSNASMNWQVIPMHNLYLPRSGSGLGAGVTNGKANIIFAADALAAAAVSNSQDGSSNNYGYIHNYYIYRYGGFDTTVRTDPVIISNYQGLGSFTDAQHGQSYLPNSHFTVSPAVVASDGYSAAIAGIQLVDYFGDAVVGKHVEVHTDTSSWPPRETDKVKITPFEGDSPDEGFDPRYLKTRSDGSATFKLTSKQKHIAQVTGIWTSVPNASEGMMGPVALEFTDEGVPMQNQSSMVTDKFQVLADNIDKATITVTLRGKIGGVSNSPIPNYHVKIVSNRNVDGGTVDNIVAVNDVTNADGQAIFEVSSPTKGPATVTGFYGRDAEQLANQPVELESSINLRFIGKIISLIPSSGARGMNLPTVIATGLQTSWRNTSPKTTVGFSRPSALAFDAPNGLILNNSALSITQFKVMAGDQPANTPINLSITTAGTNVGTFWPNGQKTTQVFTDADGTATFNYQHGTATGAVKISASIGTALSRTMTLMLANTDRPYVVDVWATPSGLDATHNSTAVRAALYRWTAAGKELIKDSGIQVAFIADDNGTVESPKSIDTIRGTADTTYTRGTDVGLRHVFAQINYNGLTLAGVAAISDMTGGGITFNATGVTINEASQTITVPAVQISSTATVGFWTFSAETILGNDVAPEINTALFEVLPLGTPTGPRLTSVSPTSAFRPASSLSVTITSADTNFWPGASEVFFTPADGSTVNGGVVVKSATVNAAQKTITAVIDITNAAKLGYWNVQVKTALGNNQYEIADLAGEVDFLITTPSGFGIGISATPDELIRDGHSQSNIIARVIQIDNVSGQQTGIAGVEVTFSLQGAILGGTLAKSKATTDANGYVYNVYTTDTGTESAEINIVASATVGGFPISNFIMIKRIVVEGDFLRLEASGDYLPLAGDPNFINLTATAFLDKDRQHPAPNTTVQFFIKQGSGSIVPSQSGTDGQGKALSTYRRADGLTAPTSITIVAKASIQGVGTVFSNEVIINIGVGVGYTLDFTCSPMVGNVCQVSTGGGVAQLTATLKYRGAPQAGWPIELSLTWSAADDLLRKSSGKTDANGQFKTEFVAGLFPGSVQVSAKPLGIPSKQIIINKTISNIVSRDLSTISAVPRFVPANGSATSLITVTVRNAAYSPLAGKTVTVVSNQGTTDTISPANRTQITDANGQAFFTVKSSEAHQSEIRATVDSITLGPALIVFTNEALVEITFDVKVPLQNKAYDRAILVYLRELTSGVAPTIFEVYSTDTHDKLTGLPDIKIYLRSGQQYSMWVKGRYHLAKARTFMASPTNPIVSLDYTDSGVGLFIGDLDGRDLISRNPRIPDPFHDNGIYVVDYARLVLHYNQNDYVADIYPDGEVNVLDFAQLVLNYLKDGATLP